MDELKRAPHEMAMTDTFLDRLWWSFTQVSTSMLLATIAVVLPVTVRTNEAPSFYLLNTCSSSFRSRSTTPICTHCDATLDHYFGARFASPMLSQHIEESFTSD
jgi:hypothetical protein